MKNKIYKLISIIIISCILINLFTVVIYADENNILEDNIIKNDIIENNIKEQNIEQQENKNTLNNIQEETSKDKIENNIEQDSEELQNNEYNNVIEEDIQKDINNIIQENNEIMTMSLDSEQKVSGISYRTHIQNLDWQQYVKDGQLSGTEGKSLRLEGINIKLNQTSNIKVKYQVHIQNIGWQDWKTNGELAGTEGKSLRLEGIKIRLEVTDDYSVMYRVHVQNIGWQDWKTDGELAGTEGQSLRLEAIEIKIVPKIKKTWIYLDTPNNGQTLYTPTTIDFSGWKMSNFSNTKIKVYVDNSKEPINDNLVTYVERNDVIQKIEGYGTIIENPKPGFKFQLNATSMASGKHTIKIVLLSSNGKDIGEYTTSVYIDRQLHVQYKSHIQNIGWQGNVLDGQLSGTEGKSLRIEAINISLINAPTNAKILYRAHIQNIGWQDWKQNGALAGTEGKSLRIEALQIKLENMDKYTVEYQVHIQDKGWSSWYIDGETAGTVGQGKRIEAIRVRIVEKYKRGYHGIDVSQYNGIINWAKVKQTGIDFAFIRVGFRGYGQAGNFREDINFKTNIQAAKQVGIPVGVYFVTQAITPEEAIEEANWVLDKIREYSIEYPIAIDIESPGLENPTDIPRTQNLDTNTRTYLAKLFCETIQNAGYTPIIYTNIYWATNKLNMSQLSQYDTWIASYRSGNPGYNGEYSIWQYTSQGSILGILGSVDLNYSYKKY